MRDFLLALPWSRVRRFRLWVERKTAAREWEYVSEGWQALQTDSKIKGWNVKDILEVYKAKWPIFVRGLQGTLPFGISPESITSKDFDLAFHNSLMCYAYAVTLASRQKSSISMLDWGGGIGHYYLYSRTLVPGLKIDYHCKDMPVLAEYGQTLFPEAHFCSDETCLMRQYDFILASTSLHYTQAWETLLEKLAGATNGYLFVTGLPVIYQNPSFVFVQRPYVYGYNTEYLSWCLNRQQFLAVAQKAGLILRREFVIGYRPFIYRAPEQCEYRGYLFSTTDISNEKHD